MTISDLRVLVDNLDEYIHIPGGIERLKKTVLHLAISGKLVPQNLSEGTGAELHELIQKEKSKEVNAKRIKRSKELPEISKDEIPFSIPSNWVWVRLGDISNYGSSDKVKPQSVSPDTWVLELEDIEKESSNLLQKVPVKSRNSLSDKNVFREGDVLYGKLRPYLDKVIVADEDGICTSEILPIRIFGQNGDPSYLRFYLKSPYFISTVNEMTYGVKMPRLGTDDGRKMMMPLPPLGEQKRIAKAVEKAFAFIKELEKKYQVEEAERSKLVRSSLRALSHDKSTLALENLTGIIKTKADASELRKAILHLAVSGQLVPHLESEGTGDKLYEEINATRSKLVTSGKIKKQKELPKIADNDLPFDIPSNWRWVKLGEIADYRKGPFGSSLTKSMFVPKDKNTIKVYEQKNAIQKNENLGEYHITRDYYESKMRGFTVEPNDIIVSCAGTIGEIYTLPNDAPIGIINQALMRVRLFEPIHKPFYIICLDKALTLNMDKAMGTAIKNIPPFDVLKNIVVPLPPLGEQERIVKKSTKLLDLVSELEKHLEQ